ncbi:RNA polymerase sigma factor RpoH [Methylovulum psychrotolerans]|jgi:RNA polymerase sigma-32 factor|uniref:RNA polymerase sigma factor RpoH n=1 Tax=Methylovulum psychrotolerans TaxID=1704499 RepID=A0A1Z4BTL3_9GAMM|nr:RNA polymerase sigma factor RpoH [Methylovulum psychrotolerans]ASF44580.1 RNA polymerase sigma factor RpoH [Methylovulum psychrotolerans]MBT9098664.1 RNA polymerase sigma factor RpoH [Methylovulum psychrotolerans]POZ52740.1 RNA polymerase sigma factor RpoH [Methylovulum psychrotolerans]
MSNALTLPVNLSVGTFDAYLNLVKQMPKLSSEQEHDLAVKYRDHGDLEAARQLVMTNLRFVVHVAKGYSGYGLSMPDIVQEGNVGLMKAVKRFDPDMGVRLVSFAVHWIKAEIHEYVIKNWAIVKIATTKAQRKLFFNLRKSKEDLGWLSNNEAEAIANDLDVQLSSVYEMEKRLGNRDMSFDISDDEGDDDSYIAPASYLQQHGADPALLLENADWGGHEHDLLHDAMATLDERSLDIVSSRWLADKKATLHELADRYNVSAERIRQLEQNAMKKLKAAVVLAA